LRIAEEMQSERATRLSNRIRRRKDSVTSARNLDQDFNEHRQDGEQQQEDDPDADANASANGTQRSHTSPTRRPRGPENEASNFLATLGQVLLGVQENQKQLQGQHAAAGTKMLRAMRISADMGETKRLLDTAAIWKRAQFAHVCSKFKQQDDHSACFELMAKKATLPDELDAWNKERDADESIDKETWIEVCKMFCIRNEADTLHKACADASNELITAPPRAPLTMAKLDSFKTKAKNMWIHLCDLASWWGGRPGVAEKQAHVKAFATGLEMASNDATTNMDVRKMMLRNEHKGVETTIKSIYQEHRVGLLTKENHAGHDSQARRANPAFKSGGFSHHPLLKRRTLAPIMNTHAHGITTDEEAENSEAMQHILDAFLAGQNQAQASQPAPQAAESQRQQATAQELFSAFAAGQQHALTGMSPTPPPGPPPAAPGLQSAYNPFAQPDAEHSATGTLLGLFQSQLAPARNQNSGGLEACRDFSKGRCTRSNCRFSHDANADKSSTPCFDFMRRGVCQRGSSCKWSHTTTAHPSINCKVCKRNDHLYGPLCDQYQGCKRCSDKKHLAKNCPSACATCKSPPGTKCPPMCGAQQNQVFRLGKRPRAQE
jgi:hypothetical protein